MMLGMLRAGVAALALAVTPAWAESGEEVAHRFGTRQSITHVALSPDGQRAAIIRPNPTGQGSYLSIASFGPGVPEKPILRSTGDPDRLNDCLWGGEHRLVCRIVMVIPSPDTRVPLVFTRLITIGDDGADMKLLSARSSSRALRIVQHGGGVIDYGTEAQPGLLVTRDFAPEGSNGTLVASRRDGFGVERVDPATLRRAIVEKPNPQVSEYISDGRGTVRIRGLAGRDGNGYLTGRFTYQFRPKAGGEWRPLSEVNTLTNAGFNPVAVDPDLDIAYGFDQRDGRAALFKMALDGSGKRELVFAHPQVDVDGLLRVGRQQRVIGVTYATEKREAEMFDSALKAFTACVGRALKNLPITHIEDTSTDGSAMLIFAGNDNDPGHYYLYDKKGKRLDEVLLVRPELAGRTLATVTPVTIRGDGGIAIPGYLTMPPGGPKKGLPAIVMPHGGPSARDEWGFDWLSQFYAARGFAVLQPNYRGSSGYGDAWFQNNGFRSWATAIADVNASGRWLVSEGIADPDKLAIVGWSYGGYAALQSQVVDPKLYKAVVAIAPVTDLDMVRREAEGFTNARVVRDFVGAGPHVAEGSPARHAAKFAAPVLMFHGDLDRNVDVAESVLMENRLRDAGKRVELVRYKGLDHYLEDNTARRAMLARSDAFLRSTLKLGDAPAVTASAEKAP